MNKKRNYHLQRWQFKNRRAFELNIKEKGQSLNYE
jgi:hypothetical protein